MSTDAFNFSFQGVSGNSIYSVPNAELLLSLDISVNEFPRENLRFLEVLGEGQFGEVHLCEASDMARFVDNDYILNRTITRPILVAVKILSLLADDRARLVALIFTSLRANSAGDKLMIFFLFFFSQKIGFDISCKLSAKETIWVKCQNLFTGKDWKINSKQIQ